MLCLLFLFLFLIWTTRNVVVFYSATLLLGGAAVTLVAVVYLVSLLLLLLLLLLWLENKRKIPPLFVLIECAECETAQDAFCLGIGVVCRKKKAYTQYDIACTLHVTESALKHLRYTDIICMYTQTMHVT